MRKNPDDYVQEGIRPELWQPEQPGIGQELSCDEVIRFSRLILSGLFFQFLNLSDSRKMKKIAS